MKLNTLSTLIASSACIASSSAFSTGISSNVAFSRNVGRCMSNDSEDNVVDRRGVLSSLVVGGSAFLLGVQPSLAGQTYLTEPTDEFKESERQRMEFRQKQFKFKTEMQTLLDRISKDDDKEDALVKDLEELQALIIKIEGMPLGIKKDDLVKQIRSRKAKGPWGTQTEYAYQDVIREIAFQQSPNKDKDASNPL